MPDCVYKMGNLRIVDLTKVLDPKTESRRCHLIRYNTGGPIPDFHTALDLTSHLGTHCECPYHHFEDGKSVGEAVQGLISQLGALPHMGALFRSVPKAEIDEITRWLNVAIEWAENSKRAINSIQGFIDDDSDYSVK